MKLFSRSLVALAGLALASSSVHAQGQLWVVDKAGGPGSDFTEIQPAIDAAADGDTVLVKPWAGTYGAYTIDGKGLVVSSYNSSPPVAQSFAVRNLASAQDVSVRGMIVSFAVIEQNAGPVWLEDMRVGSPVFGSCFTSAGPTGPGLLIDTSAAVVATRCAFFGTPTELGTAAVDAASSSLYLFESTARGGMPFTGPGAPGVSVTDSFLFASGCEVTGGCGSSSLCGGFGGGPALERVGGSTPQLLGTVLTGGEGGCSLEFPPCGGCGPDGEPSIGGYELVAGYARDYVLASPAPGGQTTTLAYTGKPGDFVFSLIGLSQAALYLPNLAGALVVPIPPLLIAHGPADGAGQLNTVVPLPLLPPGIEAFTVYAQSAAVSSVGAAVLGAPTQLTIL
jgi:hypothetical protein